MACRLAAALGSSEAASASRCVRVIAEGPPCRARPAGSGCKPCPGSQQQPAPLPAGAARCLLLPRPCLELQWRGQAPSGGVAPRGGSPCRRERQARSPSVQVGLIAGCDGPSRSAWIARLGFEHRRRAPRRPYRERSGPSPFPCAPGADCLAEEDGSVIVRDDLDALLQVRSWA